MFGMNIDVLVNRPPSIRWSFAAVVPFSALVLAVAFVSTAVNKHRRAKMQDGKQVSREKEASFKLSDCE